MAETEKTRREKVVTVLEDVAVFIGVGTILLLPAVCLFYVLMGLSLVTMCAHWLAWPIIMDSLISRYNMPEWHTVFN